MPKCEKCGKETSIDSVEFEKGEACLGHITQEQHERKVQEGKGVIGTWEIPAKRKP